jgi:hypothetical protein
MHDLIRVGMVNIFTGVRPETPKYRAESISIEFHVMLVGASLPPREILFEQEIARKLKFIAYQDPVKVADGLSYIWDENNKWEKIARLMQRSADDTKTTLRLIVDRRNAIVHEADAGPLSNVKYPISREECKDATDFIELCGRSICKLVISGPP